MLRLIELRADRIVSQEGVYSSERFKATLISIMKLQRLSIDSLCSHYVVVNGWRTWRTIVVSLVSIVFRGQLPLEIIDLILCKYQVLIHILGSNRTETSSHKGITCLFVIMNLESKAKSLEIPQSRLASLGEQVRLHSEIGGIWILHCWVELAHH